ncbi:23S ribosomal RNA methyltransferase Erm [Sciscionella marina]|uniref:23S ribosomal RNA methyltransferase Erm n=1 Tax=Sciscionella marina TaxID=508770 RepID=UPI00036D40DE|nr:23S ribosomal RNA methyltransferase Erm [Sciscionella marina]
MPATHYGGPHELGQNFLVDRKIIARITELVARTEEPVIEIGPGDGSITLALGATGRPVTAVELDPQRARRLRNRAPQHISVVNADILGYRFPAAPHVIVGNLPFHLTTALLKRILAARGWRTAILLVQWEVARRRAGVGGASLLTASWWPWYEFSLHGRVPARAFRPVPAVDGGLLAIHRRAVPLVQKPQPYQRFAREMFTGRGHGIREILLRNGKPRRSRLDAVLREHGIEPKALPKELTAEQWAALWRLVQE